MKFLLREYDYAYFKEFDERPEAQYEAFKGIFYLRRARAKRGADAARSGK